MRKRPLVIIMALLFSIIGYLLKLNNDKDSLLSESDESIEMLSQEIDELKEEVKNLTDLNSKESTLEYLTIELNEKRINLCEEELRLEQNRIIKREVFYGMIKDTDFEKYIESTTYRNYQNPLLNKVSVEIIGTSNIISFYSQLYSDYHWLYVTTNYK